MNLPSDFRLCLAVSVATGLDCTRSRPQRLEHHGCTPEKVFVRAHKGSDTIALNVNGAHNRTVQRDGEDRLGFRSAEGSEPARISRDILDDERLPG